MYHCIVCLVYTPEEQAPKIPGPVCTYTLLSYQLEWMIGKGYNRVRICCRLEPQCPWSKSNMPAVMITGNWQGKRVCCCWGMIGISGLPQQNKSPLTLNLKVYVDSSLNLVSLFSISNRISLSVWTVKYVYFVINCTFCNVMV